MESSNLKATEETFLCARFPENKRIKLLFLPAYFSKNSWVQVSSFVTVRRMYISETGVRYKEKNTALLIETEVDHFPPSCFNINIDIS